MGTRDSLLAHPFTFKIKPLGDHGGDAPGKRQDEAAGNDRVRPGAGKARHNPEERPKGAGQAERTRGGEKGRSRRLSELR